MHYRLYCWYKTAKRKKGEPGTRMMNSSNGELNRPKLMKSNAMRNIRFIKDEDDDIRAENKRIPKFKEDGYEVIIKNDSHVTEEEEENDDIYACDDISLSFSLSSLAISLQAEHDEDLEQNKSVLPLVEEHLAATSTEDNTLESSGKTVIITAADELEQELLRINSNSDQKLSERNIPEGCDIFTQHEFPNVEQEVASVIAPPSTFDNSDDATDDNLKAEKLNEIKESDAEEQVVQRITVEKLAEKDGDSVAAQPSASSQEDIGTVTKEITDSFHKEKDDSFKLSSSFRIIVVGVMCIVFKNLLFTTTNKGLPNQATQSGKLFRLHAEKPSSFILERCDDDATDAVVHACAMLSNLKSPLVSSSSVSLIEPEPLAVQARRAISAIAKDINCSSGGDTFLCLQRHLLVTTTTILIDNAHEQDAAVLKWHLQAELGAHANVITRLGPAASLLPSFGLDLGHTYTADLNKTVSRWTNLPSVFNCLKNDVISNPTSLDAEAAEYFHTCTTIRQKAELAILGKAKAGKSTFINALVGRSVLPVHSDVCTATIIKLSFPTDGRTEGFSVQYKSSDALDSYMAGLRAEEVRYKADCDYATTEWLRSEISSDTKEKICQPYETHVLYIAKMQEAIAQTSKVLNGTEFIGDLNRLSHYADGTDDNFVPVLVDTIHMYVVSDILQYVSLVDTPGMGDNNEARNNASQRVLNSVDGYVYIVSAQEMKTADVRKELEWIRVVAGAIPHVKLLSRMNEFTSWRLNPIKSKRSKDIDSALMERRKEYNSFDRDDIGSPIPWNNALGVMLMNQLLKKPVDGSNSDLSVNAIISFLKGNVAVDHMTNILGPDDDDSMGFRNSLVAPALAKLIDTVTANLTCIGDSSSNPDVGECRSNFDLLKSLIVDSSGLVQSMLAVKTFISDLRLQKALESCDQNFNKALKSKADEIDAKIRHHMQIMTSIINFNSTGQSGAGAGSVAEMSETLSAVAPENAAAVAAVIKQNLVATMEKLLPWDLYVSAINASEVVTQTIMHTLRQKWRELAVDSILRKRALNRIADELDRKKFESVEFTYCGYLICSANVDLYELYDIPLVERFVTLAQREVNLQLAEFHANLTSTSLAIGVDTLLDYPKIQASAFPVLQISNLTGSMLGIHSTSLASTSWEHDSLFYRWACDANQCQSTNLTAIIRDAVKSKLVEKSRAYKATFQHSVEAMLTASLSKAVRVLQEEIQLQIRSVDTRLSKWYDSKIEDFVEELKALDDDAKYLNTVRAANQSHPTIADTLLVGDIYNTCF